MAARTYPIHQVLEQEHDVDESGNPSGGQTSALGLLIEWQDGPCEDGVEPNGCFVETVIRAAIGRIQFYQTASEGRFACEENGRAIVSLSEALSYMKRRESVRLSRGVLGTHKP